jgi:hypothetical protein
MRTGVAVVVVFLVLAASAEAKLSARVTSGRTVVLRLSGVPHVKRVAVRWGDGRRTASRRHRYAAPGRYTIRVRILRRGHRHPRSARTSVLVPGPVTAHHVTAYLVSDGLACGAASLEGGLETSGCGTQLTVGGVRYGPGAAAYVPVTSYESGSGTAADPYVLTRVVRAGGQIELVETTRYAIGSDTAALTTFSLRSVDGTQHVVTLAHFADCAHHGAGSVTKTSATCRVSAAPASSAVTLADLGQDGHPTAQAGGRLGLSWQVTVPALSAASVTEAAALRLSA